MHAPGKRTKQSPWASLTRDPFSPPPQQPKKLAKSKVPFCNAWLKRDVHLPKTMFFFLGVPPDWIKSCRFGLGFIHTIAPKLDISFISGRPRYCHQPISRIITYHPPWADPRSESGQMAMGRPGREYGKGTANLGTSSKSWINGQGPNPGNQWL